MRSGRRRIRNTRSRRGQLKWRRRGDMGGVKWRRTNIPAISVLFTIGKTETMCDDGGDVVKQQSS